MVIEIRVRPKVKIFSWTNVLFVFSIIGFLVLGGAYWYIDNLSQDLKKQSNEKDKYLLKTEDEAKLEEYIFLKEEKVNAFANIFPVHKRIVNIFLVLESLTHPGVQFLNFNFSSQKDQVELKGKARSFIALGQQLLIFKNAAKIKEVKFSGISLSKDGVSFAIGLVFDPAVFE